MFVRVRPPFQHEIDDKVFDPRVGPHGEHSDSQWQCTFTDLRDPQYVELMIPKEVPKEFQFDRVFGD